MNRMRFDDLPMVVKIGFAPALALIALALVTAAGLWTQHEQSGAIERIAHKDMAVSLELAQISKRIAGVHGEIYVLLTQQAAQMDPVAGQTRIDALGKETDTIKSDLTKVETQLPPDQRKAFSAVNSDLNDYRGAIDVVGSMLAIDFKTAQAFVAPFEAHYTRMTRTLDKAAGAIQQDAEAEAKASAASASLVGMITAIGSGLTLLLVSAVGLATVLGTRRAVERIARATESLANGDNRIDLASLARKDELGSVVRSLEVFRANQLRLETLRHDQTEAEAREAQTRKASQRLQEETAVAQAVMVRGVGQGLSRLAQGDLTFRLLDPFAAEYEQIRSDFNAAVDQLQETLQVIARTAGAIGSGAKEIADASDDLSRRTEQQAASLQETASALDEITGAVKRSASSAHQASEVVSVAKTEALSSGEVVKQAVAAMGKIEESSRQISQIIGVIDEIAFQTNLLALNAGVEAARAGDSGRGFAVVAQEVRALAQRSAGAAREIKALISASSDEVGSGVTLVGQTGSALERIIGKVAEIDSLIVGIAATANAQASGIGEVNLAVNHMDQMTQQNAAMVEECTAATQTLKSETAELARLISAFKMGSNLVENSRVHQERDRRFATPRR
jgi:methyl-accepting chemotaxis protein